MPCLGGSSRGVTYFFCLLCFGSCWFYVTLRVEYCHLVHLIPTSCIFPVYGQSKKNSNPPCLIMTMVAMRSFLACKNQMAQCQCQSHCNKSQKSKRQRTKCKLPASQSANSDVRKRFPHKKASPPANPSLSLEHCHLQRIVLSNPFSSGIFISSKNCFREFSCSFGSQKH